MPNMLLLKERTCVVLGGVMLLSVICLSDDVPSVKKPLTQLGPACPMAPALDDFQLGKYMGKWYEIAKFPGEVLEDYEKCISENLLLLLNGTIIVQHDAIDSVTLQPKSIPGYAVIPDVTQQAKLVFYMQNAPTGQNYWVIGTDYNTYAISYTCTFGDTNGELKERCKVFSRSRTMSPSAYKQVIAIMQAYGIDPTKLVQTDQSNCIDL